MKSKLPKILKCTAIFFIAGFIFFSKANATQAATISGVVYANDESTPYPTVTAMKLVVNGSTSYSTSSTVTSGAFSFTSVTAPTNGDVVTIWLDTGSSGGVQGTTVFKYGASCTGTPDCTGIKVVRDQVRIENYHTGSITNSDLSACDNDSGSSCADVDIGFTSAPLALSWMTNELKIGAGVTFAPGGNVTTQNFELAGTYTGGSETLTVSGDFNIGAGTFNAATSTVTLTGGQTSSSITKDSFTGSNDTELSTHTGELAATWTKPSWGSVSNAKIHTNRLVSDNSPATQSIYYQSGTLANNQYVQATFTRLSSLAVNAAIVGRLQTGADTYYWLRHNAGNWELRKTVNSSASALTNGTCSDAFPAGESRNVRLEINGTTLTSYIDGVLCASVTDATIAGGQAGFRFSTGATTTTGYAIDNFDAGDLGSGSGNTITGGGNTLNNLNINPYTPGAITMQTSDLTVGGIVTISTGDTFVMNASRTLTLSGSGTPLVNSGTLSPNASSIIKYTGTSATTIASTTYGNLELKPAGTVTYTLGAGTLSTSGNITLGNGTNAVTVNATTNDPIVDVNGNFSIAASATFIASNSAAFTIAGNFTDAGTFTHSSGTITFDTTAESQIDGNSTIFYNFTSTTSTKNIKFKQGETVQFAGLVNLDGVTLDTISGASTWTINYQGTDTITNTTITRSACDALSNSIDVTTGSNVDGTGNGGCWLFTAGGGVAIQGVVYKSNGSTLATTGNSGPCDTSTSVISIRINGGTAATGTCNGTTAAFNINTLTTPTAGDTISIYLTSSMKANTVYVSDGTADTGINLYENTLAVGHTSIGPATILDLLDYDSDQNNTDMLFDAEDAATDTLITEDGVKLTVLNGKTFTPGGTVTTSPSGDGTDSNIEGDVEIQSSATLAMGTNTLTIGGDFTNAGTFSKSTGQTTTFTATATGHTIDMGTGNFDSVTMNGASGGWSFSDASNNIDDALTVTLGTLSGTTNLTVGGDVTGAGTIALTGGTFTHSATTSKNFGGSAAWTFNNLTFSGASGTSAASGAGGITVSGVLTIGASHTLHAGSKTWTLSGSGTPFVPTGTFTAGTSTFLFTGAGAAEPEGTFTLYQANIQSGLGTDSVTNYSRLVDILAGTGVDLVTVNEQWVSDVSTVDTLLAAKGFTRAFYVGNGVGGDPSATQDGQAIWYRNSTVTLNHSYTHALSTNMVGFGGTHVDKSAGAVDITVSGKRFYVVSAHLCWSACADSSGSSYSAQRVTQINELNSWIGSTLTGGYDIVIAGDLNMGPDYPVTGGGTQLGLLTNNYTDLWIQGITDGTATAPWGDRNSDSVADMPVTNLTTRTHDTRRIDYVLLNHSASSLALNAITVPDWRATCPHGLVAGGAMPSCSPEVTGGTGVSGQQWDIEDDFGVRPSDHNFVKATFDLMSEAGGPVTIPAQTYFNLDLNSSGNTFIVPAGTLTINGDLDVSAGTLDLNTNDPTVVVAGVLTIDGTLSASNSGSLTLNDDFINNGTFTHNSGTVTLSPAAASVDVKGTSNTTFYSFTMNGPNKTLQFKNGGLYTFAGVLTLAGVSGQTMSLQSTTSGSQWDMTLSGLAVVSDLTVKDSGCAGGNSVTLDDSVTDGGNNDACWVFADVIDPDVTDPVVSITSPAPSATVSGASVSIVANATDNVGVVGVTFFRGATQIGSEITVPSSADTYTATWDTTALADGMYSLTAVARDADNNSTTSSAVSVTVDNTAPVRSDGEPSGALDAGTTETTLSLTTNETATCKYDTAPGVSYGSMDSTFTSTGSTSHSSTLSGLTNGTSYTYYVRCQDTRTNTNVTDYTITFSVASVSSGGEGNISGGGGGSGGSSSSASPAINNYTGCEGRNTGFSVVTGRSCVGNIVIPTAIPGCNGSNRFSPVTGQACSTITTNTPVIPTIAKTYNFGLVTLKNGSRGEAVKELQRFLNDTLNLGLVVDGILGPKTIAVIIKWQKDHGLVPDGLVGPKTKALMNGGVL